MCHHAPVLRRALLAAAVVLGLALAGFFAPARFGWLSAAPAAADVLSASVATTPSGPSMPEGFVGVSFEVRAVHQYTGNNPLAIDPVLLNLLKGLAPDQQPIIRIGGNSTDDSWWPLKGDDPARRDLLPDHDRLAAHDEGAGRRPEREADPRRQPRRRPARDRRSRGPSVRLRDRKEVHRRAGDRQRAQPVPGVQLVQGSHRPRVPLALSLLQPRPTTSSSSSSGRRCFRTWRWPAPPRRTRSGWPSSQAS